MASKRKQKRTADHTKSRAAEPPAVEQNTLFTDDSRTIQITGAILAAILIGAIWWNRFLPMQDYPQHLFMAVVANEYNNPALNYADNFELRNQFGPYRATHLALRGLCYLASPEMSSKIMATLYVLLVGLVAYRVSREGDPRVPKWAALVLFPLALHPMYFYGFINYFISIPVLLLAVLDLKPLILNPQNWRLVAWQIVLQVSLFLLHPYTLLVFIVLALASVGLLARDRAQVGRGLAVAGGALALFFGGLAYEATIPANAELLATPGLNPQWWPFVWNLEFLTMNFTGMQIRQGRVWWVAGAWIALAAMILWQYVANRREQPVNRWMFALFGLATAGFFVLPFSIQTDGRYTFFNARMAPVCYFLLATAIASIPVGRVAGRAVAVLCLVLTCYSANLHHRVASEVASFAPLLDNMEPNSAVLTIISGSPSQHLDRFYYANFHYCFPFYYHITRGGLTPDMFDRRLMPVGYRPERKPGRPPAWQPYDWLKFASAYDYVFAQNAPTGVRQQLDYYGELLGVAGPWSLYRLKKEQL